MKLADVIKEAQSRIADEFKGDLSGDEIREVGVRLTEEIDSIADDEDEGSDDESDDEDDEPETEA